jgi:hypothetical protein
MFNGGDLAKMDVGGAFKARLFFAAIGAGALFGVLVYCLYQIAAHVSVTVN